MIKLEKWEIWNAIRPSHSSEHLSKDKYHTLMCFDRYRIAYEYIINNQIDRLLENDLFSKVEIDDLKKEIERRTFKQDFLGYIND